jgi:uncharacterized protein
MIDKQCIRTAANQGAGSRYAPIVTRIDLGTLRLRLGEVRHERLALELEPFLLGGQRYVASPVVVHPGLVVSQASGAMVFDLAFEARLVGPCMRCLADAEVDVEVSAREFHDADPRAPGELRSDYVVENQLLVGTWARDAMALELPERILCAPDCAGLCPVCGKDLNAEPHEHAEQEVDPRWAALEDLRDRL